MIEVDSQAWPLLRISFVGQVSDEEFRAYLDAYTSHLARGERYATVYLTQPNAPMTRSLHARQQADWMRAHQPQLSQHCAGVAFVLPSPIARGVLRAILTMASIPVPYVVLREEAEGVAWALEALQRRAATG